MLLPLHSLQLEVPKSLGLAPDISLQFVQKAPKLNYDREVLQPLYAAQQAERERIEAARVAEALKAQQALEQAVVVAPAARVQVSGTCADWMSAAGIVDQASAYQLIMRESGCNPSAVNPGGGACGIGQQLPCGKWPHAWNDPIGGMIDMQVYVFGSYGSWANALNHSLQYNWY